jgi:DNA polymerase III epsilon subunit-like protein
MTPPRATWFCIDIEANGPVPGLYDMVSLGATVVFTDTNGTLSLGEDFYMELKPVAPRFDARAAAIHDLDQIDLAQNGLSRADAATRLADWVGAQTRPDTEPVFVGHNAPFDWSHVAYLYAELERPNPFGYKALDTKALSAGVLNLHWLDTGKEVLFDRLSLPPEDRSQKHRADYDARVQAELLRALLNHHA